MTHPDPGSAAAGRARVHSMPFGAQLQPSGGAQLRLWAPAHDHIGLELDGAAPVLMSRRPEGWHHLTSANARAGSRYHFVLPDGRRVPDPASRFQPEDVHAASELIDSHAYRWQDQAWRGRPWREAVLYELHVGAFTGAGTFRAAIGKLDHLAELGITAIELMPVADFPGQRNWGYDGTLLFAPDASYGRPEDLKALIDAAHARGLMVLLDVVYSHFGPEGNYLPLYAPQFFNPRHHTPWGAAVNFDGPASRTVREFMIHNALYWIEEFHLDGLRLDAVHAIVDQSSPHILEELATRMRAAAGQRHVHLLLENERNQAHWLERDALGRPRWYEAQWNDDVHHVLHVATCGESQGYYRDYRGDTGLLARALAEGFAFQGEHMTYSGRPRGSPSAHLPPEAFVAFLQNHDQIGNRAFGERLSALAAPEALHAASAVCMLLPQIPMLFMGEEWDCRQPFLFFCDFSADLAEAVRAGRRREFARFPAFQDPQMRERIPDPLATSTFEASRLDWSQLAQPAGRTALDRCRALLAARRRWISPLLPRLSRAARYRLLGAGAVQIDWSAGDGTCLTLRANLSDTPVPASPAPAPPFWQEGTVHADGRLGPRSLQWIVFGPTAAANRPQPSS